jgi:hypothetical protein
MVTIVNENETNSFRPSAALLIGFTYPRDVQQFKLHFVGRKYCCNLALGDGVGHQKEKRRGENCCDIGDWYRGPCSGDDVRNFTEPRLWRCPLVCGHNARGRGRLLGLSISDDRGMCAEHNWRQSRFL